MPKVVLIGPQRHEPTVTEVIADLGLTGPFALITAGWKDRESEDGELRAAIGGNAYNLNINKSSEALLDRDPELAVALRKRQDRLRELQDLYRLRLTNLMQSARRLLDMSSASELIEAERSHAIEMIRELDRHHLARVADIHRRFEEAIRPSERRELMRERSRVAQMIHDASAVLIAGGHVAVLLNRLRLYDVGPTLHQRPVIAWSAGAMCVSERIVLFHDSPPQGPGNAEVLDRGLGLIKGVLPLPNASERLELSSHGRVALLARRFVELVPVVLDPFARIDWDPPNWCAASGTWSLGTGGGLEAWEGT